MDTVPLDRHIVEVLMRDLVGHDRSQSAFILYLWLWTRARASGRPEVGASLRTLATETGLSKSSVQNAVRALQRRGLLDVRRDGSTAAPFFTPLEPWRR